MKNLYKYLLLFCLACNYFSMYVLVGMGLYNIDAYNKETPDKYFRESAIELSIIFTIIVLIAFFVKGPRKIKANNQLSNLKYKKSSKFVFFCYAFYWVIILFLLFNTNYSFDLSSRGVGQFELENRQTLLQGIASNFLVPFVLYALITGIFKPHEKFYVGFAVLVYIFQGLLSGGRGNVVAVAIMFFVYLFYVKNVSKKNIFLFSLIVLVAMSFSAAGRFENESALISLITKIIQCNGTSDFLATVKYSIDAGVGPFPYAFFLHFVSLFLPSYILVNFFGTISYTRTVFIYDELYNPNPDSGWGFMMISDFYWCFEYFGYILYLFVFYMVVKYFAKNIYSTNPVKVVMSIVMVYLFCNQRCDFGVFLKPLVYTSVFLSIFEHYRKKAIIKK